MGLVPGPSIALARGIELELDLGMLTWEDEVNWTVPV